ncbi:MAG TPA: Gldg family protein [Terricaulis sp.]|nr:Gldg family protein [Terricaulis sp.]
MSARRFAFFAALAFALMFIAGNLLSNSWLRAWRLDLTQDRLYSISPGTQTILNELSEPVTLTLYYSRDAGAAIPALQTYAARVREMLQTYAARSRGRVRFAEVNVETFTEAEDEAAEAGLQPYRPGPNADPIYFGVIGSNAIDDTRAIPFFDPQREAFLEYELTRIVYELENPSRTRVALITSLNIDPNAAQTGLPSASAFGAEMGRFLDVTKLDPDFSEIPDVDVLAIIHPGALSQAQLYAIDQFILRRGRAFIALDPASLAAQNQGETGFDPFNPAAPPPTSSTLEPMLARWGVSFSSDVVLDGENALPIRVQRPDTGQPVEMPQPLFFVVPGEQLNRDDLMTAWLRRGINFGLAGGLNVSQRPGLESVTLARTSGDTMRIPAEAALARPSPFELAGMWRQGGGRMETVAVRLSGAVETAFANGPPEGVAPGAEPLTRSHAGAEIVIVADADFLDDVFYIDPSTGAAAADNASFALNAIDVLGGSDALVSLRSRASPPRRMEMIDDLERQAQEAIESREEQLRADLQATEARLAQLQAQGRGSGAFSGVLGAELTQEEAAVVRELETRLLEVRGELRRTERELRGDVDRLEALVVFINVWLMPLLVAGAGLFFFWRRQRRARTGAGK